MDTGENCRPAPPAADGADELWPGGPRFCTAPGIFKLGTDSVLLADFAGADRARTILDLGCGGGVLLVLLALRAPRARLEGIEISPEAAALCEKNLSLNGLTDRCRVTAGDLREHRKLYAAGSWDLVVSNPPYFPVGSGYMAPDERRAAARSEGSCTLADLCAAARYLTRWGGLFALVHRPERMSQVLRAMSEAGLEPKRLRMIQYKTDSAPNLFLAEGRRGGKPGLEVLPPLILAEADGSDSGEIRRIYHRGTGRLAR